MTGMSATSLFVLGLILGVLLGFFLFRPKKAGVIQILHHQDSATTWQYIFDITPDEVEKLKQVMFKIDSRDGDPKN